MVYIYTPVIYPRQNMHKSTAMHGAAFKAAEVISRTSSYKNVIGYAVALCLSTFALVPNASAETLVIPGSGNPEFILTVLANAYNKRQSEHRIIVPPTIGTSGALREVTEGTATMGRVGRPLKGKELSLGLTYRPIGRDPVAFVGGAGVTVSNISTQQAIDIFTGKIVNWRELGGRHEAIRTIGREKTDASRQAIMREIKAFENLQYHDNVKLVHLDSQLIELLDRFPASFAFLNRSALSGAKTKLIALQLDSVEPSADNVDAGRYKLWTEIGLIYRESSLTVAGRSFLEFVASPYGTQLLRANGLLPSATQSPNR